MKIVNWDFVKENKALTTIRIILWILLIVIFILVSRSDTPWLSKLIIIVFSYALWLASVAFFKDALGPFGPREGMYYDDLKILTALFLP
jgi:hypothetical protein